MKTPANVSDGLNDSMGIITFIFFVFAIVIC